MVIAALVTFGILFVAWLAAPSAERTEPAVVRPIELLADAA
jgi:hypothetical protein